MEETELSTFYASCDAPHREFFSVLVREWQQTGLPWEIQGHVLGLCGRSVTRQDGSLCLFELRPEQGIESASIGMNLDTWRSWLGQEESDAFVQAVKQIDGLKHKTRGSLFMILEPGHMSGPMQQGLRDLVRRLATRLPDLIAP
ncbi:MAG: hypothetical protein ACE5F3_06335 [Mariprofundaceae bacterium]